MADFEIYYGAAYVISFKRLSCFGPLNGLPVSKQKYRQAARDVQKEADRARKTDTVRHAGDIFTRKPLDQRRSE